MPNNFCFHVYAQKSLIISEIGNEYFLTAASASSASPSPVSLDVIELVLNLEFSPEVEPKILDILFTIMGIVSVDMSDVMS